MTRVISKIQDVVDCTILKRLNRFVVEVTIDGRLARSYINNTGRLAEFITYGRRAYCLRTPHTKRTGYRLFAIHDDDLGAIIDTQMQMRFFEEAVERGAVPWLSGCRLVRRNARLGSSLIDYLFDRSGIKIYVEAKSAVLRGDGRYAMYPDCPTVRGRRHIQEIIRHASTGGGGVIVFIAALPNVQAFRPNSHGDPEIPPLLSSAKAAGVQIRAFSLHYAPRTSSIHLDDPDLKVELPPLSNAGEA